MSSALDSELHTQIENNGNSREEEITSKLNVLQKHVAYFDKNHDGIIYPWETYTGFRAIGCGVLLSAASAFLINLALSRRTLPQVSLSLCARVCLLQCLGLGKFPSLLLPIYVENIHKAKHGSDSGVYDSDGRFVPSKFEDIFRKHARSNPKALTSQELMDMLKANREPKDYNGWLASWTEWKILFFLCKDKDGLLHKETIRAVYDGSLFELMEKERASKQKTS